MSGDPGVNCGIVMDILELFFSPEVGDKSTLVDTKRVVSIDDGFFVRQDGHYPKNLIFSVISWSIYYTIYYCFLTVIRGLQGGVIRVYMNLERGIGG